jgi:uncharacterized LabA/DUF88 family protein
MDDKRFAILIDADNISAKYIPYILDEISNYGVATYKRIYGDWTKPTSASWKDVLLENSITPIQQYGYTTGKNATDSAMIIDAMDILYSKNVDGFCIASSDSDFTKLSSRLRESAMFVIGMGERKTPKPFIASCNQFKYLDVLAEVAKKSKEEEQKQLQSMANNVTKVSDVAEIYPDEPYSEVVSKNTTAQKRTATAARKSTSKTASKTNNSKVSDIKNPEVKAIEVKSVEAKAIEAKAIEAKAAESKLVEPKEIEAGELDKSMTDLSVIRAAILKMLNDIDDTEEYMNMGEIGSRLMKRYPDFDVRNYGDTKLSKFLKKFDFVEIHTLGNSTSLWVCLKKEKPQQKGRK